MFLKALTDLSLRSSPYPWRTVAKTGDELEGVGLGAGGVVLYKDEDLEQLPEGIEVERNPDYDDWLEWAAGTVFEPPAHMNVARALERGIAEEAPAPAPRRARK